MRQLLLKVRNDLECLPIKWLLALIILALPIIYSLYTIYVTFNSSLGAQVVDYPNDQVAYFVQVAAFGEAGFKSGYFAVAQRTAPFSLIRFGAHGPVYIVSYGSIAKLLGGWEPYYATLANIIIFTLALLAFMRIIRASTGQIIALGLVLISFYPAHVFLLAHMQEILHQAFAILFAAYFFVLLTRRDTLKPGHYGLILALIIYASLMRYTWSILYFPFLFFALKNYRIRPVLGAFALATGLSVITFLFFRYTYAPYPYSISNRFINEESFSGKIALMAQTIEKNYGIVTDTTDLVGLIFPQMCILILIWGIVFAAKAIISFRTRHVLENHDLSLLKEAGLHLIVLVPILGMTSTLYSLIFIVGCRIVIPYLLMSLCLLIAFRRYMVLAIFVLLPLLFIPVYKQTVFDYNESNFRQGKIENARLFQEQTAPYMSFDPDEPNPWCNTLLISYYEYRYFVMYMDGGMGLSWTGYSPYRDPQHVYPQYILLLEPDFISETGVQVELLTPTISGNLYRNLDTNCP